jgi:hypothetical protein
MALLDLKPVRDPATAPPEPATPAPIIRDIRPTRLSAKDAIDIWLAHWLKIPHGQIIQRYNVDARRIYEVWWEEAFIGSRQTAWAKLLADHPERATSIDNGRLPRFERHPERDQHPSLFATLPEQRGPVKPKPRRK